MNSKRKGNAGELELLHALEARGIQCRRNEQGLLAGFAGGAGNPDIAAQINGHRLHIEVKRAERFSLYKALAQAQEDARGGDTPLVCYRANRKPWTVVLSLDDFLSLV